MIIISCQLIKLVIWDIGNMSDGFKKILTNVEIIELKETEDIIPAYKYAYEYPKKKAFLIVEFADFYNEK